MKYIKSFSVTFAAIVMLAGCTSTSPVSNDAPAASVRAIVDGESRNGTFSGLSDHITTGDVTIVNGAEGVQVVLGTNFSFDGAPDPKVALGKNGEYDPATVIDVLRSDTGEQAYQVPASINVDDYDEVYIWCDKFSVGLGVASLSSK